MGRPIVLAKSEMRNGKTCFFDQYPGVHDTLREAGLDGTETAITITGDPTDDAAVLARVREWARLWHDAGLNVFLHPYTQGFSSPAQCATDDGGTPFDAFRRVADESARLSEAIGQPVCLTYHAAAQTPKSGSLSREELLIRSARFFRLAFDYLDRLGADVSIVSETQLPPKPGSETICIGDRPDEVLATLGDRSRGACWDTGHYMLSVERVGIPVHPTRAFVQAVTHMHVHDVIDHVDHRPLTAASTQVAEYVGFAGAGGSLRSVTLEYDYQLALAGPNFQINDIVAHVKQAAEWVRKWAAGGAQGSKVS